MNKFKNTSAKQDKEIVLSKKTIEMFEPVKKFYKQNVEKSMSYVIAIL